MSDVVIRVENVSKKYVLKHTNGQRSGDGLRHAIQDALTAPFRMLRSSFDRSGRSTEAPSPFGNFNGIGAKIEDFYALRHVNFEVKRGEVLGVIGRNGAGKSTLLKILSRITEPSSGRIGINGRVASLLEVGTGFHPELTGRENIFLNGAILGMNRIEVRSKFDAIVAFAEVEKFLDTPVKRYSSGMYVRLAFAVAAHLEPEILIVDEVLAVGDAGFQKKCLGKMQDVANSGRAIIFVSHDIQSVRSLCDRVLLLANGEVNCHGDTARVVELYNSQRSDQILSFLEEGTKDRFRCAKIIGFEVTGVDSTAHLSADHGFLFSVHVKVNQLVNSMRVAIGINDRHGHRITTFDTSKYNMSYRLEPGTYQLQCRVPALPLRSDDYSVHIFVGSEYESFDYIDGTVCMRVGPSSVFSNFGQDTSHGAITLPHEWMAVNGGCVIK